MRNLVLRWLAAASLVGLTVAPEVASAGVPPSLQVFAGHAWFGIAMETAKAEPGVRVKHVVHRSPAEKAGIQPGDSIRTIDRAAVGSPEDVSRIVSNHAPGDSIPATVLRAGHPIDVHITLEDRPTLDEMARMDRVGEHAPSWSAVTAVGDAPDRLESLHGQVVVLDFWATWCGACRALAPTLSKWQAKYGAQGLRVVGLTTEPAERAATFAAHAGLRYAVASDPTEQTTLAYGVSALPTMFVIDKQGVIRDVAIGADDDREERIEQLVKQLLAE